VSSFVVVVKRSIFNRFYIFQSHQLLVVKIESISLFCSKALLSKLSTANGNFSFS